MLIIGERINSSIKKVEEAIKDKNTAFIQHEAKVQVEAGADVIDVNAGTLLKSEGDDIVWLIDTVNQVLDINSNKNIRIAVDSANPEVISQGLEKLVNISKDHRPFINSVTADKEKLDAVFPLVKKFNAQLVGLLMSEGGIPEVPQERCELGRMILKAAEEYNINPEDVYLDPLILPVSTDSNKGVQVLEIIKLIKELEKNVKIIIGLSNISYGLPERPLLNQTFMAMAMAAGVDAAIINPLDQRLMNIIKAADAILGNDEYCMNYITAYRNGEFKN